MGFNIPNIDPFNNVPQNNFGLFNNIPQNNFGWDAYNPQNPGLNQFNTMFQGLKPQESGLEQIWRQIRDYKPSKAEALALATFAAVAVAKVSDEVVNQIKLWKRNVREQKAAAAVNQGRWDSGGVGDNIIQFFTPKSTQVDGYFQLDPQDDRPKFLYLSAEYDFTIDENGIPRSLNPQTEAGGPLDSEYVSQLLSSFDKDFDLKFSLVGSYEDICHEIEEGSKTGKLMNVIIDGHGYPNGQIIALSEDPKDKSMKLMDEAALKSNPSCFSGLQPSGRVLLTSCCTGSPVTGCSDNPTWSKRPLGKDNIAETLSNFAQRTVVAPTISIKGVLTKIQSTFPEPVMLTHPDTTYQKPGENVFKTFNPKIHRSINPECRNLLWDQLHPRELEAMDAIKTDLLAKALLSSSVKFQETQEYLRVCKEDPKPKVLYLSAKHDVNGALEPKKSAPFLSSLAQNYDLKFKVISSSAEICQEISEASKAGTIAAVVINAHGASDNLLLSNIESEKYAKLAPATEWINDKNDFAGCFAPLHPSGKIIFAGGLTGAPQAGDRNNNLAQKAATKSNLRVVAPIQLVSAQKTTLASTTPFTIFHPKKEDPTENAFQEFVPGDTFKVTLPPNCLFKGCPDLKEENLYPRELAAIDAIKKEAGYWTRMTSTFAGWWQNYLRLEANNPKPKFLFLTGKYDHSDALHPKLNSRFLYNLTLPGPYDLKYAVIDSWKDVCNEVAGAAKTGKVANVLIDAHGSGEFIYLSDRHDGSITKDQDYSGCFSGLQKDGRIILDTCAGASSNGNPKDSLAQKIADTSKQTVVSANKGVSASHRSILTMQPFMPFHSEEDDPKTNIYQTFYPSKSANMKDGL